MVGSFPAFLFFFLMSNLAFQPVPPCFFPFEVPPLASVSTSANLRPRELFFRAPLPSFRCYFFRQRPLASFS